MENNGGDEAGGGGGGGRGGVNATQVGSTNNIKINQPNVRDGSNTFNFNGCTFVNQPQGPTAAGDFRDAVRSTLTELIVDEMSKTDIQPGGPIIAGVFRALVRNVLPELIVDDVPKTDKPASGKTHLQAKKEDSSKQSSPRTRVGSVVKRSRRVDAVKRCSRSSQGMAKCQMMLRSHKHI